MNYQEKIQAKKERYENLAEKTAQKSNEMSKAGWNALKDIPFGQPILVGHHSEKSDRAYRSRATNKIDRAVELSNKADYYAEKASRVGTGGISSDDPEAVKLLKEKMETKESEVKNMKEWNIKLRKYKTKSNAVIEIAKLEDSDPDKKMLTKMLKNCDYYAFPPEKISAYYFTTTNHGAEIRRIKQRIESLVKQATMVAREDVVGDGYKVVEDKEDNRIKFLFEGKPEAETRSILKHHGFRWSPRNEAWQRMLNNNGRYSTKMVIKKLKEV